MSKMTPSQMQSFLDEQRHAILATIRKNGMPQLSPVWYIFEDGLLYISVMRKSAKHYNVKRDPRVTVCIDGGPNDVRTVTLSGEIVISQLTAPIEQAMPWRIVRKYSESDEAADAYIDSAEIHDNILLVLTPTKIITQDFSG